MAPISRLALDLDGTLIDARLRQAGVAAEALAELTGQTLDETRFWRAKRRGATTAGALRGLGFDDGVVAAVSERWSARIESDPWLERDRALPGAGRALRQVRGAGIPVAVITARRRPEGASRSLRAAGLEELVDELIVVDPAEAVAAKAAALERLSASGFAGDTDTDGAAAAAAGVAFAAVATGQRSPGYLRARGYEPVGSLGAALRLLAPALGARPARAKAT